MTEEIKNLTQQYLNSLDLWSLSGREKNKITDINSESGWIIFNAKSLKGKSFSSRYVERNYSAEVYEITSPSLRKIFKETILKYREKWGEEDDPRNLEREEVDPVVIYFFGADGESKDSGGHRTFVDAIPFHNEYSPKTKPIWVAVNKKVVAKYYDEDVMRDVKLYRNSEHWKKSNNLNQLLEDYNIIKSKPPNEMPERNQNNFPPPEDNNPPPPQNISFEIEEVWEPNWETYVMTPKTPFNFQGTKIDQITIKGNKIESFAQQGNLAVGNKLVISGIQLGRDKTVIRNKTTLKIWDIGFAEIKLVTNTYGEVSAKNEALLQEENSLEQLAIELSGIVEKNKKICREAGTLGLTLSTIDSGVLNFFYKFYFKEFDDKLPLDSLWNQDIYSRNQRIRRQKINIKANVYRIYDRNLKALTDAKKNKPSVPNNELEKLKNKVMVAINEVLNDNNNLQNINLITFENGEYLNWEKDLWKLTKQAEITAFQNKFLMLLKKASPPAPFSPPKKMPSPNNLPENGNEIDINEIKQASSLAEAKKVAKKIIRKLFTEYENIRIEDLEAMWVDRGEISWLKHLEKLNNREQVIEFVQDMKKSLSKLSALQNLEIPSRSSNFPYLNLLLVGLFFIIFIVGLVLIFHFNSQKKKKKTLKNDNKVSSIAY